MRISFTTGCKNRLEHIQHTLPRNIEDNPEAEFVLVDYNCPQKTGDWIKSTQMHHIRSGRLIYLSVLHVQDYNRSHAKNIAAKFCTGDVICNMDADNYSGSGFAGYLSQVFEQNINTLVMQNYFNSTAGRLALSRDNYCKIAGYDEQMVGWGGEDCDFRTRALLLPGIQMVMMPRHFAQYLSHGDDLRGQNIQQTWKANVHRIKSRTVLDQPVWGVASVAKNFQRAVLFC